MHRRPFLRPVLAVALLISTAGLSGETLAQSGPIRIGMRSL